jgi:hypothetical protein
MFFPKNHFCSIGFENIDHKTFKIYYIPTQQKKGKLSLPYSFADRFTKLWAFAAVFLLKDYFCA